MRSIAEDPTLRRLRDRIFAIAREDFAMVLPEVRFFVLDAMEFASLLEKRVYPVSPVNIWEGKRLLQKKFRMANGFESSLYYEVVQTGDPSYAYLNDTNSPLMQASVMAHVLGHCEFSELNVLGDSDRDRTEYVMYLSRKVEHARRQMGERRYLDYWNACESLIPLIAPNSQFDLERSVEVEDRARTDDAGRASGAPAERTLIGPVSESLNTLFAPTLERRFAHSATLHQQREHLSLRGYRLRAPCEDVAGFVRLYAPASASERAILDYFYASHAHQDFVRRTQIMNEGWAMYWEKKIMLRLFSEKAVSGVIDYARVFASVCYPRPWFARNPYHLGFHLWSHIEEALRTGRHSLEYFEEIEQAAKDQWDRPDGTDPAARMRQLLRSVTDYEFLRRFLTPALVKELHLNRIPRAQAARMGISEADAVEADEHWLWVDPEPVPEQMLSFFTHFYQPRVYAVDSDFEDGGLLLMHRDDGRELRNDWIGPTLRNLHYLWKGPVYLLSRGTLFGHRAGESTRRAVAPASFDEVRDRMRTQRPIVLEGVH